MPEPPSLQKRRGEEDSVRCEGAFRKSRARVACRFGCPCCGPLERPRDGWQFGGMPRDVPVPAGVPTAASSSVAAVACQSLAAQVAQADGSRECAYIDTHVHLEMVLQKMRWYECAPSCLKYSWDDLSEMEQQCWGMLGHSPSRWSAKKPTNQTWYIPWRELPTPQQTAARALGWDASAWDGCNWLLPKNVLWRDLDATVQQHLVVLGETCDSWDEMFDLRVPAGYCDGGDMRRWSSLRVDEQKAAALLGFSPTTWDMEEMLDLHAYIRDFCGSGFEGCITQGCDSDSIDPCVQLVLTHPHVYAALGCHPKNAWLYYEENMEERLLKALDTCGRKVVAWGEFGLDFSNEYWWDDPEYRREQIEIFERQLELAISRQLPLVLHLREAAEDSWRVLRKRVPKDWKAHIHGFHGPSEFVTSILDAFPNFYFGMTGTVAMGEGDGARIARILPPERMLLETDGPYLLPPGTVVNHVGQIPLIAREVAKIIGCDAEELMATVRQNSRHVYGI